MTQREQYGFQNARCVYDPFASTPENPDRPYSEIVLALAVKAQVNAIEAGIDISYEDAYQRANENLAYVRVWAATGRRPS